MHLWPVGQHRPADQHKPAQSQHWPTQANTGQANTGHAGVMGLAFTLSYYTIHKGKGQDLGIVWEQCGYRFGIGV